jgi:ABC-type Fe3+ transport system substrate-binding protein
MELTFPKRYGIGVEFVPARGGTIIRRMVDESKAGVQYFDIHIGGTESIITGLLPENVLEPVEPYFVLPEVRDPKQWWGGHIWVDNAKRFIYAFVAYQTVSLWSNSNEYKPSEFRGFDDLLNPKLQSRIGISDPRTPGSGSSMWSYMNYIKGEEYLKRLVAQKLFVTRDLRLLADNLAKGKIAVTLGIGYSEFLPFIKAGLPVMPLPVPKEGLYVSGGYGHVTILKNPPHQRDEGLCKLATGTRWTRDFLQRDGSRFAAFGHRHQMAERVRHHRVKGCSFDDGTVSQIRKPIGRKDLQGKRAGGCRGTETFGRVKYSWVRHEIVRSFRFHRGLDPGEQRWARANRAAGAKRMEQDR